MNEPSEPGIHEGRMTGTADRPFEAGYATPMSGSTSRLREPAERENGVGYSWEESCSRCLREAIL